MIKKIVVDFFNREFSVHLWSNRPDSESYLQSTLVQPEFKILAFKLKQDWKSLQSLPAF
jgi:hypothetical protein